MTTSLTTERHRGRPDPRPAEDSAGHGPEHGSEHGAEHGVEAAPYALARVAALPYPAPDPATARFRAALAEAAETAGALAAAAGPAADALHASAPGHGADFHRRVVLPLRRDIHNGRTPRRADLDGLRARVPELHSWLTAHERLAAIAEELTALWPDALAADRARLAELCGREELRKAATLTGRDLLHGIDRAAAAGAHPDKRARKSEHTALRYALRAAAKTSPLSWYTHVAFGLWEDEATEDVPDSGPNAPRPTTRINRALLDRMAAALVADPARRAALPHRLAADLRERDGQYLFNRDVAVASTHLSATREEEVRLPATPPVRFVVSTASAPRPLAELVAELAARLPGADTAAARSYVDQLVATGLLVPLLPVGEQDTDAAGAWARWLREAGAADVADQVVDLDRATTAFGDLPAAERVSALAALAEGWAALGEAVGADMSGAPVLAEDVAHPAPVRLGAAHGRGTIPTLTALTPLTMLFDHQLLVRRLSRDRFVERFGEGAEVDLADGARMMADLWSEAFDPESAAGGAASDLTAARTVVADLVAQAGDGDREIPHEAVLAAADLLPHWMRTRPVSYSFFAQPLERGLVVNHVYAGFGRFTSRFLDQFAPAARAMVATQVRRSLADLPAQFRPTAGFNANLHPLVTQHEVGEDPARADITTAGLVLRHDPVGDQLRVRHRTGGVDLDVLYLGFLVPFALPERLSPLVSDLACGLPGLSRLAVRTGDGLVRTEHRLTYRDVVLVRRSVRFHGAAATALRAGLGGESPALAAARLRGEHGLPAEVFVSTLGGVSSMSEFSRRQRAAKPQYVDLADALHLRCLPRLLDRHPDGFQVAEATPVPGATGTRVTEMVIETYRRAT
ncbi:lantibiotic dehydratase [Actinokineospora guangxiensis]|uniref:Lantibiotic dehydratase n=1 Tax=Actinokineospora guangxiensis TaxID=1490288 RepID=A0ABW0ERD6_9PSEU